MVPQLAQFSRQYPDISVLIDSSPQLVDLERSNIDIAIRYGVQDHHNLVHHRLVNDQVLPACSPAIADALPENKCLADLATTSLIHWDTTQLAAAKSSQKWFVWKNWLAHFNAEKITTNTGLHFSDYSQALQAAIAGQGVILVSKPILNNLFQAGLLTYPFHEKAILDIGYDVVATRESMARTEVQTFVDWIVTTIKQEQGAN